MRERERERALLFFFLYCERIEFHSLVILLAWDRTGEGSDLIITCSQWSGVNLARLQSDPILVLPASNFNNVYSIFSVRSVLFILFVFGIRFDSIILHYITLCEVFQIIAYLPTYLI